jgi:hypothetical protein
MRRKLTLTVLGLTALAGCGTPPKGIEILVSTVPPGAGCALIRAGQPIGTAEPTPAIAIVPIDPAPILVQCRRPGFQEATAVLPARGVGPGWTYAITDHPASDYQSAVTLVMTPGMAALLPPR